MLCFYCRFLATGDSYQTIAFSYRCGKSTVAKIIPETCAAIWQGLVEAVMPEPSTEQWRQTASKFAEKWNFPNCVGSVDGKHVLLQKPAVSGSLYYNYKKTFSVVLMAVVDAEYRFIAVDIGQFGRVNDSICFRNSIFGQRLSSGLLQLPPDIPLPGCTSPSPHVFVADEAFPLQRHLMRPFPGSQLANNQRRIFNYRLSRARRTVENAFGIMSSRFRIFRRPICMPTTNSCTVVKACTVLHNFLLGQQTYFDMSELQSIGSERHPISSLRPLYRVGRGNTMEAKEIRDNFAAYFVSPEGEVSWQLTNI